VHLRHVHLAHFVVCPPLYRFRDLVSTPKAQMVLVIVCVCLRVCVCERDIESVCARERVCVRERARERKRPATRGQEPQRGRRRACWQVEAPGTSCASITDY